MRLAGSLLLLAACGSPSDPLGDLDVGEDGRRVGVHLPPDHDPNEPAPLLVVLHGYTESGAEEAAYFGIAAEASARGMILAHPDGTFDALGYRFWNATPGCCDLFDAGVDDSRYLRSVIDEIVASVRVDPAQIYLIGHSNGGFMSYRMACDHADVIAGIVSLAGATFAKPADCAPSAPVAVLQIHGTADEVIPYAGDDDAVPGARVTVETWARYNGCGTTAVAGAPHDIDSGIAGAETTSEAFTGCPGSSAAELWTIPNGLHTPPLAPSFAAQALDFLVAHRRR